MPGKRITWFEFSYPFSIFFEFILFQILFILFQNPPKSGPAGPVLCWWPWIMHKRVDSIKGLLLSQRYWLRADWFDGGAIWIYPFSGFLNLAILLSFYPFSCHCVKAPSETQRSSPVTAFDPYLLFFLPHLPLTDNKQIEVTFAACTPAGTHSNFSIYYFFLVD